MVLAGLPEKLGCRAVSKEVRYLPLGFLRDEVDIGRFQQLRERKAWTNEPDIV
jgi:hypothetical protein